MTLLERILTRIMLVIGFALAAKDMVAPEVEEEVQLAWRVNATRLLDIPTVAQLVAQHLWSAGEGFEEAARAGIGRDRFASAVELATGPPDVASLENMRRRGLITDDQLEYAFRRLSIENTWHAGLHALLDARLSPADVANAVQQGFVPNDGLLAVTPPTGAGKVAHRPPVNIDPVHEAQASGVSRDRLEVLARLAGLPPGPMELLEMLRRGFITEDDVARGIAEGHTKTEWADAYLAMRHNPLSAAELALLVVKKWITLEEGIQRAELVGVAGENFRLLVLGTGRPPAPGQLQAAFNRGLINRERFDKGIAESDLRTEWSDVHFGLRVRYPSTFALRQMVSSGALDAAEGQRILELEGWETELARKVTHAWADGQAGRVKELTESQVATLYESRYIDHGQAATILGELGYPDDATVYLLELADARRVKRFLDTAVGKLHTLYINHRLGERDTVTGLGELGVSSQAVDDLLATWKLERAANVPGVTPAEITTAVRYELISRAQGIQMLTDRGYTEHDARFKIDVRMHSLAPGETL